MLVKFETDESIASHSKELSHIKDDLCSCAQYHITFELQKHLHHIFLFVFEKTNLLPNRFLVYPPLELNIMPIIEERFCPEPPEKKSGIWKREILMGQTLPEAPRT